MDKLYGIKLTKAEIYLLDGQCRPETQQIIEDLREQDVFGFELPLINEIIQASKKTGKFTVSYTRIG